MANKGAEDGNNKKYDAGRIQVLKGLDFERYRPKIIVIETWEFDRIFETDIFRFLSENGYKLRQIFEDNNSAPPRK